MRHWFVPACLCLVTWSGATSSDPTLSFDKFSGFSIVDKDPAGSTSEIEAIPAVAENSVSPELVPTAARLADVQIEIPAQTAGEEELKIEHTPLPPLRQPVVQRSYREVCDTLANAARSNDLPVPFFIRLLFQESGFRPEVVSRAGAEGVAQFMPDTSASLGVINPFDPVQAIPASARLLRNLFHQFGNLGLAAAAYNAGPKRIEEWLTKKGKLPQETQGYVKSITGRPVETWKVAAAGNPEMKLPRHAPCQETAGLLAWNGPNVIPMPRPSPFTRPSSAHIRPAVQAAALAVRMERFTANSAAIIYIQTPGKALTAHGLSRTNPMALGKQTGMEAKLANKLKRHDKTARRPLELAVVAASSLK